MSTLKEEIDAIIEAELQVLDRYGDWGTGNATTNILALIRERLLSDEAQAGARMELHTFPRTNARDTVETAVMMTVDRAFGEES